MAAPPPKVLVVVLGAAGAAALGFVRRGKGRAVAGTGGGASTGTLEPPPPTPEHRESGPPQPANYDASGPVANTATPIPAPDRPDDAFDEEAEIAAAAAEAAAIGGGVPEYPGLELSSSADEAMRPVEEAGGGESEGQELAEYELVESAQPSDTMSDAERQIEETIEAQGNPALGERVEPLVSHSGETNDEAVQAAREAAMGDMAADEDEPETWSGRAPGS